MPAITFDEIHERVAEHYAAAPTPIRPDVAITLTPFGTVTVLVDRLDREILNLSASERANTASWLRDTIKRLKALDTADKAAVATA